MIEKLFQTANKPFSPEAFHTLKQSLILMGEGMLGIFIVMALFWVIIIMMSRIKDK
jgi:hypothetical protein